MGEVASLIGPLSNPEVLIRCRDLFGMCSHVCVNQEKKKKKEGEKHPTVPTAGLFG